jgi:hypothetical protein
LYEIDTQHAYDEWIAPPTGQELESSDSSSRQVPPESP